MGTTSTMYKPCVSLIVLLSCTTGKYLGVYHTISPSIYPVRTALDVFRPSYGYGYPWAFAPAPFLAGIPSFPRVVAPAEEVAEEEEGTEEESVPVVTIQHTIDSLPLPPNSLGSNSKFRNPLPPAIPAGIVQATQPTFGQVTIRVLSSVQPLLSLGLSLAVACTMHLCGGYT